MECRSGGWLRSYGNKHWLTPERPNIGHYPKGTRDPFKGFNKAANLSGTIFT